MPGIGDQWYQQGLKQQQWRARHGDEPMPRPLDPQAIGRAAALEEMRREVEGWDPISRSLLAGSTSFAETASFGLLPRERIYRMAGGDPEMAALAGQAIREDEAAHPWTAGLASTAGGLYGMTTGAGLISKGLSRTALPLVGRYAPEGIAKGLAEPMTRQLARSATSFSVQQAVTRGGGQIAYRSATGQPQDYLESAGEAVRGGARGAVEGAVFPIAGQVARNIAGRVVRIKPGMQPTRLQSIGRDVIGESAFFAGLSAATAEPGHRLEAAGQGAIAGPLASIGSWGKKIRGEVPHEGLTPDEVATLGPQVAEAEVAGRGLQGANDFLNSTAALKKYGPVTPAARAALQADPQRFARLDPSMDRAKAPVFRPERVAAAPNPKVLADDPVVGSIYRAETTPADFRAFVDRQIPSFLMPSEPDTVLTPKEKATQAAFGELPQEALRRAGADVIQTKRGTIAFWPDLVSEVFRHKDSSSRVYLEGLLKRPITGKTKFTHGALAMSMTRLANNDALGEVLGYGVGHATKTGKDVAITGRDEQGYEVRTVLTTQEKKPEAIKGLMRAGAKRIEVRDPTQTPEIIGERVSTEITPEGPKLTGAPAIPETTTRTEPGPSRELPGRLMSRRAEDAQEMRRQEPMAVDSKGRVFTVGFVASGPSPGRMIEEVFGRHDTREAALAEVERENQTSATKAPLTVKPGRNPREWLTVRQIPFGEVGGLHQQKALADRGMWEIQSRAAEQQQRALERELDLAREQQRRALEREQQMAEMLPQPAGPGLPAPPEMKALPRPKGALIQHPAHFIAGETGPAQVTGSRSQPPRGAGTSRRRPAPEVAKALGRLDEIKAGLRGGTMKAADVQGEARQLMGRIDEIERGQRLEREPERIAKLTHAAPEAVQEGEKSVLYPNEFEQGGERFGVTYAVVRDKDIAVSHDDKTLARNPNYPRELQNRNREQDGPKIDVQVAGLREDPGRYALPSTSGDQGPPVVWRDAEGKIGKPGALYVLAGNGRMIALRRFARKSFAYSTAMAEQAKKLGIDVKEPKGKVLVRILDDMPFKDAAKLVGKFQGGSSAPEGRFERSRGAAGKVGLEKMGDVVVKWAPDGPLNATNLETFEKNNPDLVRKVFPGAESGVGVDAEARAQRYKDVLTGMLPLDLLDAAARLPEQVQQDIYEMAPQLHRFAALVVEGKIDDRWDFIPDMARAITVLPEIREQLKNLNRAAMGALQIELFKGGGGSSLRDVVRALEGLGDDRARMTLGIAIGWSKDRDSVGYMARRIAAYTQLALDGSAKAPATMFKMSHETKTGAVDYVADLFNKTVSEQATAFLERVRANRRTLDAGVALGKLQNKLFPGVETLSPKNKQHAAYIKFYDEMMGKVRAGGTLEEHVTNALATKPTKNADWLELLEGFLRGEASEGELHDIAARHEPSRPTRERGERSEPEPERAPAGDDAAAREPERPVEDRGEREPGHRGADAGGADGPRAERAKRIKHTYVPARAASAERIPSDLVRHLDQHQVDAISHALEALDAADPGARGFVIADGTGVGKTREMLAVAEKFRREGKVVVLVGPAKIGPKGKPIYKSSLASEAEELGIALNWVAGGTAAPGRVNTTSYFWLDKVKVPSGAILLFDEAHALKNADSGQTKAALELISKADAVLFASATIMDKAVHLPYLARAGALEGRTVAEQLAHLGMRLEVEHRINKKTGKPFKLERWIPDPRARSPDGNLRGSLEVTRRQGELVRRMVANGRVIKREIGMEGVSVTVDNIKLGEAWQAVENKLREKFDGKVLQMHESIQQEPFKIPHVVKMVSEERAAGRSVIIFAARVNESAAVKRRYTKEGEVIEEVVHQTEGTLKTLREKLIEAGIPEAEIGEIHGGVKADVQERSRVEFQSNKRKVIIATAESGGAGINLDDTTGKFPRTMIVMTAPYSGVTNAQAWGRIWRLNTKGDARIRYVYSDSATDVRRAAIVTKKMLHLGAALQGEHKRLMEVVDGMTDISDAAIDQVLGETVAHSSKPDTVGKLPVAPLDTAAERGLMNELRYKWAKGDKNAPVRVKARVLDAAKVVVEKLRGMGIDATLRESDGMVTLNRKFAKEAEPRAQDMIRTESVETASAESLREMVKRSEEISPLEQIQAKLAIRLAERPDDAESIAPVLDELSAKIESLYRKGKKPC